MDFFVAYAIGFFFFLVEAYAVGCHVKSVIWVYICQLGNFLALLSLNIS